MSESNWLADQFLRSVEGEAWHGPSLMEVLKDISHTTAASSPGSGRHGIWELLLHLQAWTVAAQQGIRGQTVDLDPADDWPSIGEVSAERWAAAITGFREQAAALAATVRTLTPEDFRRIVPGREYDVRFLVNGVVQHTAYHTGQIALLRNPDGERRLLRHTLATMVYRGAKALRGAPAGFATFSAGPGSRTPVEILAHIGDLLVWARGIADGDPGWREVNSGDWDTESKRFFDTAQALDARLAGPAPTLYTAAKIFQGPIADALQHIGQLTYLRRLASAPIRGESYFRANIETGRTGPDQAAPIREFE